MAATLVSAETRPADRPSRHEISLEANPVRGTLAYIPNARKTLSSGITAGFGFPQLDRTLAPADGELLDILHIGPMARWRPANAASVDLDVRLGIGDLRSCGGSDCLPGIYAGTTAGIFVGGRHVRLGPRFHCLVLAEPSTRAAFVVAISPVNLLAVFSW